MWIFDKVTKKVTEKAHEVITEEAGKKAAELLPGAVKLAGLLIFVGCMAKAPTAVHPTATMNISIRNLKIYIGGAQ